MNNSKFIDSRSYIKYRSSIKKFVFLSVVCFLAAVLASCGLIADNFRDAGTDSNGFSVNVRSAGDSVAGSRVAMTTTTTWDSEAAFNAAVSQYRVKVGDEPWQVVSPGGTVTSAVRYAPGASVAISYIAEANVEYTGTDGQTPVSSKRMVTISEETKTVSVGATTTRVNFRIRDGMEKDRPAQTYNAVKVTLKTSDGAAVLGGEIYPEENENISDFIIGHLAQMRGAYFVNWVRGKTYRVPQGGGDVSPATLLDNGCVTITFQFGWDTKKYILVDANDENAELRNYLTDDAPAKSLFSKTSTNGQTMSAFTTEPISAGDLGIPLMPKTNDSKTVELRGYVAAKDAIDSDGNLDSNFSFSAIGSTVLDNSEQNFDMKLDTFEKAGTGDKAIIWIYRVKSSS